MVMSRSNGFSAGFFYPVMIRVADIYRGLEAAAYRCRKTSAPSV